ncbi:hypothetical protein AWW72_13275 [Acinetobacter sp. NRRL B-65365]|uniref:hypothetical protein n=1 Tax=Acinetobacter sp. NRRL B-65365 TaxID=1785092 RepID=UPI0007A098CE|nr:hypothetical protein [Acinetobacter sp. NRRL B-65365]KYQ83554.1 hypothetical protein AWW72_13275 [Acinetobacter sp. NRRL B-65365]
MVQELYSWVEFVWELLGKSQVQTVIAIVAFWLAYKGYLRVLDQIKITNAQENESYEQRNYELKIEVMSMLLQIINTLHNQINDLLELKNAAENTPTENLSEEEKQDMLLILDMLEKKISETESLQSLMNEFSKNLNKVDKFDYKKYRGKLNDIYEALFASLHRANEISILKTKYLKED